MLFYDLNGNAISQEQWILLYSQIYFTGYNKKYKSNRIFIPQTSEFVENAICELLSTESKSFSRENLQNIFAWKTGMINMNISKIQNSIKILNDLREFDRYRKSWSSFISKAFELFQLNYPVCKPEQFFDSLRVSEQGNAPVYAITMLFFFSSAEYPIYDRFAWLASCGIINDDIPNNQYKYNETVSWQHYLQYCKNIKQIFGDQSISRDIDRALYVYGHFFQKKKIKPKFITHKVRHAVISENSEIHFRPYLLWKKILPIHDSIITIVYKTHFATCALGNRSSQYWTKKIEDSDLGDITWSKFFSVLGIQDRQKFSVEVQSNNNTYILVDLI